MILAFLFFFATAPQSYRYWVEPCTNPATGCQAADPELGDWAVKAWQDASGGQLEFTKVADEKKAHIRLYWAGPQGGLYGEARPILVDGKRGAEVYVLPAGRSDDRLMRDTIVYLTCLHETGHALGLSHTANFEDIMYSFQFGGDIAEYFGRYRRKLKTRTDIRGQAGMSATDRARLAAVLKRAE